MKIIIAHTSSTRTYFYVILVLCVFNHYEDLGGIFPFQLQKKVHESPYLVFLHTEEMNQIWNI